MSRLVVLTFEENRIFMLGVVFLFSQFSPIEIIPFYKTFLFLIEDIDFLSSNLKRYFTSDYFFCKGGGGGGGGLKIVKFLMFWTKLCAL